MNAKTPTLDHVYTNFVMDSTRWDGWRPRPGDVFVCTAYKAGTTWTQMICALLVHQKPILYAPISEISPWLEMQIRPAAEALAMLEAQTHRRVVKTHTPLDGLPYFEDTIYLFCGRDPRDIFISMSHHFENANMARIAEMVGVEPDAPPELPTDVNELFELWLTRGSFDWEEDGFPFWSAFHHAQTFWDHRDLPNIHFLHYADLKADLDGQMRRVAEIIATPVGESIWADLVNAATFDAMKTNADMTAPDGQLGTWKSNAEFFKSGANEQWRDTLDEASLTLYDVTKYRRMDKALADWMEQGSLAMGDPKAL